jgi:hypothetical protein
VGLGSVWRVALVEGVAAAVVRSEGKRVDEAVIDSLGLDKVVTCRLSSRWKQAAIGSAADGVRCDDDQGYGG